MYARKLLTIALSTVLLIGAGAAVGAATPADASTATDERADGGSADEHFLAPGPDGGLPGPVPDRVSEIHDTISSFLNGGIDHLGSALSDLTEPDADGGAASGDTPNTVR